MDNLITEMTEATEENIKGLKVIGITINTYITKTLIQHKKDENAHSGLKEKYIQSLMSDIERGLENLEAAKIELEEIIQKLKDIDNVISQLEGKNV